MRLDFVSDVAVPWCAVGLHSLERALEKLGPEIPVNMPPQLFELNPGMGAEGPGAGIYLKNKYGMSDAQLAQSRGVIRPNCAHHRPVRLSWGKLLERVFNLDVELRCRLRRPHRGFRSRLNLVDVLGVQGPCGEPAAGGHRRCGDGPAPAL